VEAGTGRSAHGPVGRAAAHQDEEVAAGSAALQAVRSGVAAAAVMAQHKSAKER